MSKKTEVPSNERIIAFVFFQVSLKSYISALNDKPFKLGDQFTYISCNILSTGKQCPHTHREIMDCYQMTFDHLEIWSLGWYRTGFIPSCYSVKLLHDITAQLLAKLFSEETISELQTLLRTHLNKSWMKTYQHKLYHPTVSHLTNHKRRTSHDGHSFRSKNELRSNILLWALIYRHPSTGWPADIYMHQLCAETIYSLEDLPEWQERRERERQRERWYKEGKRERVKRLRALCSSWW